MLTMPDPKAIYFCDKEHPIQFLNTNEGSEARDYYKGLMHEMNGYGRVRNTIADIQIELSMDEDADYICASSFSYATTLAEAVRVVEIRKRTSAPEYK